MKEKEFYLGQITAINELLKLQEGAIDKKGVLGALVGFDGVGKRFIVDNSKTYFGDHSFIHNLDLTGYRDSNGEVDLEHGLKLTAANQGTSGRLNWNGDIVRVPVKGMNKEEISNLIVDVNNNWGRDSSIPNYDSIVEYSLGIPKLAKKLLLNKGLSESDLAMIASAHLFNGINMGQKDSLIESSDFANEYLQVSIPTSVLDSLGQTKFQGKYLEAYEVTLSKVLDWQLDAKERFGDDKASMVPDILSPLFVCAESVDVYRELRLGRFDDPQFSLFATNLTEEDVEAIKYEIATHPNDSQSRRFDVFGSSYRYTRLNIKSSGNKIEMTDVQYLSDMIDNLNQSVDESKLPIVRDQNNKGSLFVYSTEEDGDTSNSLRVGMAVESLLQQMGKEYIVEFGMNNTAFKYIPQENSLNKVDTFLRNTAEEYR